jgi:hypothetical protein
LGTFAGTSKLLVIVRRSEGEHEVEGQAGGHVGVLPFVFLAVVFG